MTLGISFNIQYSNAQMQTRYSLECGLPVDIEPELYEDHMLRTYGSFDNMPPDIREKVLCSLDIRMEEQRESTINSLTESLK